MVSRNTALSGDFRQLQAGRDEPVIDPGMPIVDAHHHFIERPGLRYGPNEYLADAGAGHRIIASVYVETLASAWTDGPEVLRPLGEIAFADAIGRSGAAAGACRVCAAIIGHADMRHGDRIAELLDRALALAPERFRGIRQVAIEHPSPEPFRFIPTRPPAGLLTSPSFRAAFAHLGRRELSFDAAVFHHQLPEVAALADAFPDVKIILNHCGHAMLMELDETARTEAVVLYRQLLRELGRRPNVFCKVGGLGMPFWGFRFEEREDPVGYLELAAAWRPYVEIAIEAFGPGRCMMESNYPPDGRSAGFVPLWNALKHIVRAASAEDKAALFNGTAAMAYRL